MRTKNTSPLHPWRRARAIANPKWSVIEAKTLTELFSSPERWTQGYFAQNQHGDTVDPTSKRAEQFCFIGGAWRIYGYGNWESVLRPIVRAKLKIRGTFSDWNDSDRRKFTDIKKLAKWTDAKAKELGLI